MNKWDEFIGQKEAISLLKRMDQVSKRTHVLLHGPPGTGKTTLAKIISNGNMLSVIGSSLKTPEKVAAIVTTATSMGVDTVFIDEIHSAKPRALEILYPVMEEGVIYDDGNTIPAKIYIIAATTDGGKLAKPLVDRFGLEVRLRMYDKDEMKLIIKGMSDDMTLALTPPMITDLSNRSLGIPRTARRLVERLSDLGDSIDDWEEYEEIIGLTGIDQDGLGPTERSVLRTMWVEFNRGPVGIKTLAFATQIDEVLLNKYVEPVLIRLKYLTIDKSGRKLTAKGVARAIKITEDI